MPVMWINCLFKSRVMVPHQFEPLDQHQRSDTSKDQFEALSSEQPFAHNLPQLIANQNPEPSTRSLKFVGFLIAMLITVICIVALEFYNTGQSEAMGKASESGDQRIFGFSPKGDVGQRFNSMERKIKDLEVKTLTQPQSHTSPSHVDDVQQILREFNILKEAISEQQKMMQAKNTENKKQILQLKQEVQKLSQAVKNVPLANQPIKKQEKQLVSWDSKSSSEFVDEKYKFKIPKILWLYQERPGNYLGELILNNIKYFAKKSGYEVKIVNPITYKQYLSPTAQQIATNLIESLEKRLKSGNSGNLNNHISEITKQVILLNILWENGGIITSGTFAIAEDFSWLEDIVSNQYAIRGNRGARPHVVGFYSPYYTLQKHRLSIKPFKGMNEVDKLISIYPAMQNYFIAADKNSQFLKEVIKKISHILLNPEKLKSEIGKYNLNNIRGNDVNYEYFLIAVQIILQDKQTELNSKSNDPYLHFAVDYYGLYLINCLYAPYKLKNFWENDKVAKIFQNMARYTKEEFEENVGPMRYIVRFTPDDAINQFLVNSKNDKGKLIMMGSFIQKILFPQGNQPFLTANMEAPLTNPAAPQWQALPKIIWVFWDTGIAKAKISNQLCVQNLRRMAELSGFKVIEVNMTNIDKYLDDITLKKIKFTIENAKLMTYPQTQGDLYRLALLIKHGGVYMDASYLALQKFDWLVNIARYPTQFIFNRFGQLPKVFMFWHPHYGSPFEWSINQLYNTKSQWQLSYENNFIAAEKGADLITDWFELLLSLYLKNYNEVQLILQKCGAYGNKWIKQNDHYLLPMDTIKCVLGQREQLVKGQEKWQGASDYYRIWSMSGYLGQQKLRSNTNYQNTGSHDNSFVYRYSQEYVEGIIGKIRHVTKFYSLHNNEMSDFINRHRDGNFSMDAHPQSIFMRYMWSQNYKSLETLNFRRGIRP